jgi:hypothetical protein
MLNIYEDEIDGVTYFSLRGLTICNVMNFSDLFHSWKDPSEIILDQVQYFKQF